MIRRITSSMAACGIVALMTALNALAAERPALPELLKALNLSGYPSVMHPPEFSGFTADGQKMSLAGLRGRGCPAKLLGYLVSRVPTGDADVRATAPGVLRSRTRRRGDQRSRGNINNPRIRQGTRLNFSADTRTQRGKLIPPMESSVYRRLSLSVEDGRAVALAIGPREWSGKPARALIQALLAEPAAVKGTR